MLAKLNILQPLCLVSKLRVDKMDGLRIHFSQEALIEKLNKTGEEVEDENLDLSSFNLSLGELGQARLVTRMVACKDSGCFVRVELEFVKNMYKEQPIKIEVGMIKVDGEGHMLEKVIFFI